MNQPEHNDAPRVSVIIPAYKAARTIGRALVSVLAQTHPAHEIIVIDDGSPDEVATVVAAYGAPVILLQQPNGGAASARNRGIEHATGDFIAFLDADDYWEPQKLETQLGLFERHPELGLVAGAYYQQQPDQLSRTSDVRIANADKVLTLRGREAFHFATGVWTGVVMARRAVIGSERFVSGLEPAEDRDLWIRLVLSAPAYWSSHPLASAVLEQGSLSRGNLQRDCSNMLKVVDRNRSTLGRLGTRMWRSHTLYRWAALEPDPSAALGKLLHSIGLWPVPYGREISSIRAARVKLLVVTLLRMLRLRSGSPVRESTAEAECYRQQNA